MPASRSIYYSGKRRLVDELIRHARATDTDVTARTARKEEILALLQNGIQEILNITLPLEIIAVLESGDPKAISMISGPIGLGYGLAIYYDRTHFFMKDCYNVNADSILALPYVSEEVSATLIPLLAELKQLIRLEGNLSDEYNWIMRSRTTGGIKRHLPKALHHIVDTVCSV